MRTFDGSFVPGPIERPEPRTALQERLENKQIARVLLDQDPGPTGSPVLGIEFTTGQRLAVMAKRDLNSRYRSRLIWRFMDAQRIITPRMARSYSMGRIADPGGAPGDLPDLERWLEGQVIAGVRVIVEPTEWAGEQSEIELRGGDVLWLAADDQVRDRRYRAELLAQSRRREVTRMWMPGSRN